jgi:hypothetical protein
MVAGSSYRITRSQCRSNLRRMRNDECLILASGETASLRPCCANKVINPCASTLSLAAKSTTWCAAT